MSTNAVNQAVDSGGVSAYAATKRKNEVNGKTIGSPELSEKAQKYYEQLKKKFSNMDFILVSADMKEQAEANAGQYAQANRTVVLIDEEKIERMAEDEAYREKYEGIISNAATQIQQIKDSLDSGALGVKTYGVKIDDGGNASFFAVIDKSLAAQRKRIEEKAEKKAEEKKKTEKEEWEEKLEERRARQREKNETISGDEDLITVSAGSIEELVKKINDVLYDSLSDNVRTEAEKQVGQYIDYRG